LWNGASRAETFVVQASACSVRDHAKACTTNIEANVSTKYAEEHLFVCFLVYHGHMKVTATALMIVLGLYLLPYEVKAMTNSIYDISVTTIDGQETTLESYRGKTLLIVNTASKCGFTKQFEGLQALYEQYKDRGLVILGFPANDFLWQEPKSNSEIKEFCTLNYGVSFPMFEKISVKGRNQHPLYAFLTGKTTNPEFAGRITWNFNKFLVAPDGRIVNRFGSRTAPDAPKLIKAVEQALE
jgi:glutathione peroxidase